jgi:hypothetical protein
LDLLGSEIKHVENECITVSGNAGELAAAQQLKITLLRLDTQITCN